jgi:hypothetical protein
VIAIFRAVGRAAWFGAALFVVAIAAAPARATTIAVPTDDERLASSRAVVEGTVEEIRSRRSPEGEIFTYVTVDVSRVFAGGLAPGRIVLKEMGGRVGDDFTTVYGTPEFATGERVILYLSQDEDGALHTSFLFVGKLSVTERDGHADGRRGVARGDAGENVLAVDGPRGASTESAPYADYVGALERRVRLLTRPVEGPPIVAVPRELSVPAAPGSEQTLPRFTLMSDRARWFEPDEGLAVPFYIRYTPFLYDGGAGPVGDALAAWSSVEGSGLRLDLVDETDACGFYRDGVSTVSFDDCRGQVEGGGCFGVIAIGGASGRVNERKTINGVEFVRIVEADVVLNNNMENCLLGHRLTIREVITHELGHAIGLNHSSQTVREENPRLLEATMFYKLHEDGRGASLRDDDMDGVRFIYPLMVTPPLVATEALGAANVGAPFEARLEARGGQPPYTWAITGGALPEGIALAPDGLVAGTPAARGTASFTVAVTDSRGLVASGDLTVEVAAPRPVVASAVYKAARRKLTVASSAADVPTLELWINGTRVAPPAKTKVKRTGGGFSIVVKKLPDGAVAAPGANTLVVVSEGVASEPYAF